jgi:hypothetical protein
MKAESATGGKLARSGELATRLGEARREERRTFLARLRRTGEYTRPATC